MTQSIDARKAASALATALGTTIAMGMDKDNGDAFLKSLKNNIETVLNDRQFDKHDAAIIYHIYNDIDRVTRAIRELA